MDELTLKFLTIGDASVGKTCIMLRFADEGFPSSTMPTIGVEYKTKRVQVDGRSVRLQVWDTAGQERYHKTISSTFYRRADAILLVFDSNDHLSFDHVRNWMQQIQQKADEGVVVALVGNKSDLPRKVELAEAEALASSYSIPFFSVSAKTGDNVNFLFESVASACIRNNPRVEEKQKPKGDKLVDPVKKAVGSKCC